MNIAVFGRKVTKQNAEYYSEILGILKDFGWNPVLHKDLKDLLVKKVGVSAEMDQFETYKDFKSGIDLSLSIGGDGTFIQNVKFIRDSNVPVLGMIENMSYWSCPDCGRVDHIFGEGGVKAEAKKRNIDLLGEIPISVDVRKSSDAGIPIIISEPESIQSQNYRLIAKSIIKSIKLDEEELS